MSTERPVPDIVLAQLWYVPMTNSFGFIGEVSSFHDEAVGFVIHAIVGMNASQAEDLLGQVIVVPRQNPLWSLISGPR